MMNMDNGPFTLTISGTITRTIAWMITIFYRSKGNVLKNCSLPIFASHCMMIPQQKKIVFVLVIVRRIIS